MIHKLENGSMTLRCMVISTMWYPPCLIVKYLMLIDISHIIYPAINVHIGVENPNIHVDHLPDEKKLWMFHIYMRLYTSIYIYIYIYIY